MLRRYMNYNALAETYGTFLISNGGYMCLSKSLCKALLLSISGETRPSEMGRASEG